MNSLFNAVAQTLSWLAGVSGFTYNEINIIAYYIVLPFLYVVLLDRIIHKHVLKLAYFLAWFGALFYINDFSAFSDRLFQGSVDFLLLFSAVGMNYVAASVLICVLLPAGVFAALIPFAFPTIGCRFSARIAQLAGSQR